MSESGRENRERHERMPSTNRDFENELMRAESDAKARAAENSARDRVESAGRKAGRPEGPQGGCSPSRQAPVSPAEFVTYDAIYKTVRQILNEDNSILSNHAIAEMIGEAVLRLGTLPGAAQVSTEPLQASPGQGVRSFPTGATRSSSEGKPDYEGYLSPLVIRRYGQFMLKHQVQPDGNVRQSDNWQKGMPLEAYIKSGFRHFVEWWSLHRGGPLTPIGEADLEEALCAVIFNASGYLHEHLKGHRS